MLRPEDMVNPNVDELSMMTYLSQFTKAKLKKGAPLKPTGNPSSVKVYGPGVQSEGLNTGMPSATFTINIEGAGPGKLVILCTGPNGSIRVTAAPGGANTYACSYVPAAEGTYQVEVYFCRVAVPGSPFSVKVVPAIASEKSLIPNGEMKRTLHLVDNMDVSFDSLSQTSIEPTCTTTLPELYLEAPLSEHAVEAWVEAPDGNSLQCAVSKQGKGYRMSFTPYSIGTYYAHIKVPISITELQETSTSDKTEIIQVNLGKAVEWQIREMSDIKGKLKVRVVGPKRCEVKTTKNADNTCTIFLDPSVAGTYIVYVTCGDKDVHGSPFTVKVCDPKGVKLSGPGVTSREVQFVERLEWTADLKEAGFIAPDLRATIYGADGYQMELDVIQKDPTHVTISMSPPKYGSYKLQITAGGEEIPQSPVDLYLIEPICPESLPEIANQHKSDFNLPEITIDVIKEGEDSLVFWVKAPNGDVLPCTTIKQGRNYKLLFLSTDEGTYYAFVSKGDKPIKGSPFPISVTKQQAEHLKANRVFTQEAGSIEWEINETFELKPSLKCSIQGPKNCTATFKQTADKTYTIVLTPSFAGIYLVYVTEGDRPVRGSPFVFKVVNPKEAKISGPGVRKPGGIIMADLPSWGAQKQISSFVMMEKLNWTVDLTNTGLLTSDLKVTALGEQDYHKDLEILQNDPLHGTITFASPKVGKYNLHVTLDGREIVQSPVEFTVVSKDEPLIDTIELTDFEDAINPEPILPSDNIAFALPAFSIDAPGVEEDTLHIDTKAPNGKTVTSNIDRKGNSYKISFIPYIAGTYHCYVSVDKKPIKGSPFAINVTEKEVVTVDETQVSVIDIGQPLHWTVKEPLLSGKAQLKINIQGPKNCTATFKQNADKTYTIVLTPSFAGTYLVYVTEGDRPVRGSPFVFKVVGKNDQPTPVVPKVDQPSGDLRPLMPVPQSDPVIAALPEISIDNLGVEEDRLDVYIKAPDGKTVTSSIDRKGNSYKISFIPYIAGTYHCYVSVDKRPIKGSPFAINVTEKEVVTVDETQVSVIDIGQPLHWTIKEPLSGKGQLKINIQGPKNCTATFKQNADKTYTIVLTPSFAGTYLVYVTEGDRPVRGSPFVFKVVGKDNQPTPVVPKVDQPSEDPRPLMPVPQSDTVIAALPEFSIDNLGVEEDRLDVYIKAPDGKTVTSIIDRKGNSYKISFIPYIAGTYYCYVSVDMKPIKGSPFAINVTEKEVVTVDETQVPVIDIGQPLHWTIKEPLSGKGQLKINIQGPKNCTATFKQNADKTYTIVLTPSFAGTYLVYVTEGDRPVHGSPFFFKVVGKDDQSTPVVPKVDQPSEDPRPLMPVPQSDPVITALPEFSIDNLGVEEDRLDVYIKAPDGKTVTSSIDRKGNSYKISFIPYIAGTYHCYVSVDKKPIKGSPFAINVTEKEVVTVDETQVSVIDIGQPLHWTIKEPLSGKGQLKINIQGPKNCPATFKQNADKTYTIVLTPSFAGTYLVYVTEGDRPVHGSPFFFKVVGKDDQPTPVVPKVDQPSEDPRPLMPVPQSDPVITALPEFSIDNLGVEEDRLDVYIKAPDGKTVTSNIDRKGNSYKISFIPYIAGTYYCYVSVDKKPIKGSPFAINVTEKEVVTVDETLVPMIDIGQPLHWTIKEPLSGKGQLKINIQGPKNCTATFKQNADTTYTIVLTPSFAGTYLVYVTDGDRPVRGSPFVFKVVGKDDQPTPVVPKVDQPSEDPRPLMPLQQSDTVIAALPEFSIDNLGVEEDRLDVYIKAPDGKTVTSNIDRKGNSYKISFIPYIAGTYYCYVSVDKKPIKGSPFAINVTEKEVVTVDETQVPVIDIGQPLHWTIKEPLSGKGQLKINIQGPKNCTATFKQNADTTYTIVLTPSFAGTYLVYVTEGDRPVHGSPFVFKVVGKDDQPTPVVPKVDQPSEDPRPLMPVPQSDPVIAALPEFSIDNLGVEEDRLDVYIKAPDGKTVTSNIDRKGNSYKISFIPYIAGTYYCYVSVDKKPIKGSPFAINVTEKEVVTVDDTQVSVIDIGQPLHWTIKEPLSGKGQLKINIQGPKNCTATFKQNADKTYTIVLTPSFAGTYLVYVTEGDRPVRGSPFVFKVVGKDNQPTPVVPKVDQPSEDPRPLMPVPQSDTVIVALPEFSIDNLGVEEDRLDVYIKAPDGKTVTSNIDRKGNSYKISFIPYIAGTYYCYVSVDKKPIKGSPFAINVTEKEVVTVDETQVPVIDIGQPLHWTIKEPLSGKGQLKINIQGPKNCTATFKQNADKTYTIVLTPSFAGTYLVYVTEGDRPVRGSPFVFKVVGKDNQPTPVVPKVDQPSEDPRPLMPVPQSDTVIAALPEFSIDNLGVEEDRLDVYIKAPDGKTVTSNIDRKGNSYKISFIPYIAGTYYCYVSVDKRPIKGSPFAINVTEKEVVTVDETQVSVIDIGQPLHWTVKEPLLSGKGQLKINIQGPKNCTATFKQNADKTYTIVLTPSFAGTYLVYVTEGDRPVRGSPFVFKVVGKNDQPTPVVPKVDQPSGDLRPLMPVPQSDPVIAALPEFSIDNLGVEEDMLDVYIKAPDGKTVTSNIDRKGNSYKISFIPYIAGTYYCYVSVDKKPIKGSPFAINVTEKEVVTVDETQVPVIDIGQPLHWTIKEPLSGKGQLKINIQGPKNCTATFKQNADKTYTIVLTPSFAGTYLVYVTEGDRPVHGSPFVFKVVGKDDQPTPVVPKVDQPSEDPRPLMPVPQSDTVIAALPEFSIDNLGVEEDRLDVYIKAPDGKTVTSSIDRKGNSYKISFIPYIAGTYHCYVSVDKRPIKGSPFAINVTEKEVVTVDETQVSVIDIGQPLHWTVKEPLLSGKGQLKINIQGPKNCTATFKQNADKTYTIVLTPSFAGTYLVYVTEGDRPVRGSPFVFKVVGKNDQPTPVVPKVDQPSGDLRPLMPVPQSDPVIAALPEFSIDNLGVEEDMLDVYIKAPDGKTVTSNIDRKGNSYKISFIPYIAGTYYCYVSVDKKPIKGSPFAINVTEKEVVTVDETQVPVIDIGQPLHWTIKEPLSGKGQLKINIQGPKNCTATFKQNADKTYTIVLTPSFAGTYLVYVTEGDRPVHGSPFVFKVVGKDDQPTPVVPKVDQPSEDPRPLMPVPQSDTVIAALPEFSIDNLGVEEDRLDVYIKAPDGKTVTSSIDRKGNSYKISFIPYIAGTYHCYVSVDKRPIKGSPFAINVTEKEVVTVDETQVSVIDIGQPLHWTIKEPLSGKGQLKINIQGPKNCTATFKQNADKTYTIVLTPSFAGTYLVYVTEGDRPVRGSPFVFKVVGKDDQPTPVVPKVDQPSEDPRPLMPVPQSDTVIAALPEFSIDNLGVEEDRLDVYIKAPDGKTVTSNIDRKGNSYKISFIPYIAGTYHCYVSVDTKPIKGSPFAINVTEKEVVTVDETQVSVIDIGQPLHWTVKEPLLSGKGQLKINIQGPKNCTATFKQNADKTYTIVLTPSFAGTYLVYVTEGDRPVRGSPFIFKVVGKDDQPTPVVPKVDQPSEDPRPLMPVPQSDTVIAALPEFSIDNLGVEEDRLDVYIKAPDGKTVTSSIDRKGNSYKISFIPYIAGTYYCYVSVDMKPIKGSPFAINVTEKEVVTVDETEVPVIDIGQPLHWTIKERLLSGKGQLKINIQGPKNCTATFKQNADKTYTIVLTPSFAGTYLVYVTEGDRPVHGSPFVFKVVGKDDQPTPVVPKVDQPSEDPRPLMPVPQSDTVMAALPEFSIDNLRVEEDRLDVYIKAPDGKTVTSNIDRKGNSYKISFIPYIAGTYYCYVSVDKKPIKGSPFAINVTEKEVVTVDDTQVSVIDIGQPLHWTIKEPLSGKGQLKINIQGPKNCNATFKQNADKTYTIVLTPSFAGTYLVYVTEGDRPVRGSPFVFKVVGKDDQPTPVVPKVDQPSEDPRPLMPVPQSDTVIAALPEFSIDNLGVEEDRLDVYIKAPDGKTVTSNIDRKGNSYKISFIPYIAGTYYCYVSVDKKPIKGSPFAINVTEKEVVTVDDTQVSVIDIGQPLHWTIKEPLSGKGQLKINIQGPKNCNATFKQNADKTYTIVLTPSFAGTYLVYVTEGDRPVRGSPFVFKVVGKDDQLTPVIPKVDQPSEDPRPLMPVPQSDTVIAALPKFSIDNLGVEEDRLDVYIKAPDGKTVTSNIDRKGNSYKISFIPYIAGTYYCYVSVDKKPIKGSPFAINVTEKEVVTVDETQVPVIDIGQPLHWTVKEPLLSGKGQLKINIQGPKNCTATFKQNADKTYTIVLTPSFAGTYLVYVTEGDRPVRGSPFVFKVVGKDDQLTPVIPKVDQPSEDPRPLMPVPQSDTVIAALPEFSIDNLRVEEDMLDVYIKAPDGKTVTSNIDRKGNSYKISFIPYIAGTYYCYVSVDMKPIKGSPFAINVTEKEVVTVDETEVPVIDIGQPLHWTIKEPLSGKGQLKINIQGPKNCTATFKQNADNTYTIVLTPSFAGTYLVYVTEGDRPVRGSPFVFKVVGKDDQPTPVVPKVDQPSEDPRPLMPVPQSDTVIAALPEFSIDNLGVEEDMLDVYIKAPDGKTVTSSIDRKGNSYKISFIPYIAGTYYCYVSVDKKPIKGSPFAINVTEKEVVTVDETEVPVIDIGQPLHWTVKEPLLSGKGQLKINIQGPKNCTATFKQNADKTYTIVLTPSFAGTYLVYVTEGDRPVRGSPFVFKVVGKDDQLTPVIPKVDQPSEDPRPLMPVPQSDTVIAALPEFSIDNLRVEEDMLDVYIKAPDGKTVTSNIDRKGNSYKISFIPYIAGTYYCYVSVDMKPIKGSPFAINVTEKEVVTVDETEVPVIDIGQPLHWTIKEPLLSGKGQLKINIQGPKNCTATFKQNADNTYTIVLTPSFAGTYLVYVTEGDRPVRGSPFVFKVVGKDDQPTPVVPKVDQPSEDPRPLMPVPQSDTVIAALPEFSIDNLGVEEDMLDVYIKAPDGKTVTSSIDRKGNSYKISFIPYIAGTYYCYVSVDKKPIKGSPFAINVTEKEVVTVDETEVPVIDIGQPLHWTIKDPLSGKGQLKINIQGPKNCTATFKQNADKTYTIVLTPSFVGSYLVYLTEGDRPVLGSPFFFKVVNLKVAKICGPGAMKLKENFVISKKLHWTIDLASSGLFLSDIKAIISGPAGDITELKIDHSDPLHGTITFVAPEPGKYHVHMSFAGHEIAQSPLMFSLYDASRISVLGSDLETGYVGKPVVVKIDVTGAGEGSLSLKLDGPANVVPTCTTEKQGLFCLTFEPPVAGLYTLQVFFYDQPIPGSPFFINVSDPAACPKPISVSGIGIEGGILSGKTAFRIMLPAGFDEKLLIVNGIGPNAVCDVTRSSDKHGSLLFEYTPTLAGPYSFDVLYDGKHVAGSPFEAIWVRPPPDASKCSVVDIEKHGKFMVDCRNGGGNGFLEIAVFGTYCPAENISVQHKGDYTFDVTYKIFRPGKTTISVKWHSVHLTGSPFTVTTS